jgi:ribonuclease P protein component
VRRLKTREQYQAVLANEPIKKTVHFAMHRASADTFSAQSETWLGAMVPKRWAKRAVTRNLIKRQVYNMADQFKAMFGPQAYVVRMRCGFDGKKFRSASSERLKQEVRSEIEGLFKSAFGSGVGPA